MFRKANMKDIQISVSKCGKGDSVLKPSTAHEQSKPTGRIARSSSVIEISTLSSQVRLGV